MHFFQIIVLSGYIYISGIYALVELLRVIVILILV